MDIQGLPRQPTWYSIPLSLDMHVLPASQSRRQAVLCNKKCRPGWLPARPCSFPSPPIRVASFHLCRARRKGGIIAATALAGRGSGLTCSRNERHGWDQAEGRCFLSGRHRVGSTSTFFVWSVLATQVATYVQFISRSPRLLSSRIAGP